MLKFILITVVCSFQKVIFILPIKPPGPEWFKGWMMHSLRGKKDMMMHCNPLDN